LNEDADDYLSKSFLWAELAARIQAVIRRGCRPVQQFYAHENLEFNRVTHRVILADQPVDLSPKEYALLDILLRHYGRPVARYSIIEKVWEMRAGAMTSVVDVYINYLPRKLDPDPNHSVIRTVRGIGYQIGGD
jgi:DNA-binding response OmpR family regulator